MVIAKQESREEQARCELTKPILSRLGFAAPPCPRTNDEGRTLRRAEEARRRGNLVGAKNLLEDLVGRSPDDGEARLRLGGLLAENGDYELACRQLAPILERSPVEFAPHFERDEMFAKLRANSNGARLKEHLDAIHNLWMASTSPGLPAILVRPHRTELDVWQPKVLRAGVYLHDVGRFLPLAPGIVGAADALVAPADGVVAVVKTTVEDCRSDSCPVINLVDVRVFDPTDWSLSPKHWHYGGAGTMATQLSLKIDQRGALVSVDDCCCWKDCRTPWWPVGPSTPRLPNRERERVQTLLVSYRGSLNEVNPDGYSVRKGALEREGGTAIALPRGHRAPKAVHTVLVDGAKTTALVLSVVDGCDCADTETSVLKHAVSVVDLASGVATPLRGGDGAAAARLDGTGAVFLQTGQTVRRWASLGTMTTQEGTSILPGVLLVAPRTADGNCCGL